MEGKKISFGFLKTKKQDKPITADKKEYIECVEEKAIKVVGGEVIEETKPLVIPMKPNTLITAEKLKEIAEKVENFDEPEVKIEKEEESTVPENETLDQMAIRELVEGAKKIKKETDTEKLVVPINSKPIMDGQAEATLDDYESVPIQDFGLAMLRGMGWTPGKDQSKYKQPQLRPKGLGLGADKVIKEKDKSKSSKDKEEELHIVKNSFVKITTGKYNGLYGKVVSLDEENGRVMVDITMKKETVSLSEFMMQAVTKSEYDKQSKVINSESYEEYKKKETVKNSKSHNSKTAEARKEGTTSKKSNDIREKEHTEKQDRRNNDEKYSNGSNRNKEKQRYRKESSSSEEERSRHRKKNKKKYSSNESLTPESDHKYKSIDRRRDSSSDSDKNHHKKEKSYRSKSSKEKRDIDKKRKGKKKKRDRDRSPNYKKHRK
ncbi:G-patch domain and KOW motifs-containing protein [Maniola hyperantus]|uniref:G-patch domain and KOW motifs-containing protein n=1 Tax=Aphantopus hyperantus TaxID=2795564 RepID=UPI00156A1547|nr:G-patch domain and KOW motifs-containing protein [Maniola hyperantus]